MASASNPSSEGIARTARRLSDPRNGHAFGVASRRMSRNAEVQATGLQRRLLGRAPVSEPPWGVWPQAASDSPSAAIVERELGPAMAAFARELWRKRGGDRQPPPRGLPLLARRGSDTDMGEDTGPGGLARRMVPVDGGQRGDIRALLDEAGVPTGLDLGGGL